MSSAASFLWVSGPLHSGQTRISSSFGSTELLQEPWTEGGIEHRAYREYPVLRLGKALAFYRVLLGHHDRRRVAELQVRSAERVVVRERVRDDVQPERHQLHEEPVRIADPGHRVQALPLEARGGTHLRCVGEADQLGALQP